jgi:hypothetical protein
VTKQISPLQFISALNWLNSRPLLEVVDLYRQRIFEQALFSFDDNERPRYNLVLSGRAKKNFKTCDLILAALYRLLIWKSSTGSNECYILANDGDQARDDLTLAKKLIAASLPKCSPKQSLGLSDSTTCATASQAYCSRTARA